MKVDFSKVIKDAYDRPIKDAEAGIDLTLGNLCIFALGVGVDTDRTEDPRKKFDRFLLSCKIAAAEKDKSPADLVVDEIAVLKERVARSQPNAIVVGRAWTLLDEAEALKA